MSPTCNHGRALMLAVAALFVADPLWAGSPHQYLSKPDDWFAGDEARRVAANILSYQADEGGWPKNIDTTRAPFTGERKELKPTFDNGATTDELRFHDLAEIGYERRNGYAWLGDWPRKLLDEEYPAWKKKRAGQRDR